MKPELRYKVTVTFITTAYITVKASSAEEAKQNAVYELEKANKAGIDPIGCEVYGVEE